MTKNKKIECCKGPVTNMGRKVHFDNCPTWQPKPQECGCEAQDQGIKHFPKDHTPTPELWESEYEMLHDSMFESNLNNECTKYNISVEEAKQFEKENKSFIRKLLAQQRQLYIGKIKKIKGLTKGTEFFLTEAEYLKHLIIALLEGEE